MSHTSLKPYFLKFWYRPGTILRALVDGQQGERRAQMCALLFGGVQALPFYLSGEVSSPLIIVFGSAVGLFGLFLFAWLLRNFGRWFGAQASLLEMRIGLGWGLMPWTLLFGIIAIVVGNSENAEAIVSYAPILFAAFVYGYVILLLSTAAALRLPVLKAFLCLMVTCVVSIFPLTLLVQFVSQAFGVTP